jgi:hypothetical protein
MKIRLFVVILILLASAISHARYVTHLNGPGVEITRFFAHGNGGVTLYISGSIQNLDECNTTYRVYIPHDLPGKDTIVSTALMAYASGRKIGLHGSGCSTTPFWGGSGGEVPIINNLWAF